MNILFGFLSGTAITLCAYALINKLKRFQAKEDCTFAVVFSFLICGTAIFFTEVTEFFLDFFFGTNHLKCETVGDDFWLFRLFGFMKSSYEQRALFDTDLDMGIALISSLFTTFNIYAFTCIRLKEPPKNHTPFFRRLLSGFFKSFKNKFINEKLKIQSECSLCDLLLWWCTRAVMLYAFFNMKVKAEATLLFFNLLGTFAVTLLHVIFPSESFFARISYKVQSLLTVIIFLGSYVGNYVFVYSILGRYDLFLHFISGALCVAVGYYLACAFKKQKSPFVTAAFAFCFSCMIMPFWEFSEFIGDFIWGTSNQGYGWIPLDDSFFFKLFGRGAGNVALYPLFDTFYDMLLAFSTTVPTSIFLYAYTKKKQSLNIDKCNALVVSL